MIRLYDALEAFLSEKRLAGLSNKTISDYEGFLMPFLRFCGDISVLAVTDKLVNAYITDVLQRDNSKSTKATYIRNMKIFLRWCSKNYRVKYDYTKIRVPKSPKKNVRIYEDDEIFQIFDIVHAESDWIVLRNKSILALMLDSGMRQNEVCTIRRDMVSFQKQFIVVHGKGDKERVVPFGRYAMVLVQQYLEACPYKSKYLFVNRRGESLSRNAVKCLVHKLSKELPFDLSSHKLRHNFATNYCIDHYKQYGTMDAYKLMCLMGHEDIETTKKYLHHATEIIASQEHLSHLDKIRSDCKK